MNELSQELKIDDEVLRAPLVAADNMKKLLKEVRGVVDGSKKMNATLGNTTSTNQLKKATTELSKEQQNFIKIQQKLKEETAKGNKETTTYTDSMKRMKDELKRTKAEMLEIADTLGEDSEAFKKAAIRAGELKDKIGDVNEATKAVSGEPLERMGGSFDLVGNKLRALDFKGALGGVKQFTAASKELTFKQASQGLGQFVSGLGQMAKAIFTNPLFILVGVVIGVVTAVVLLRDKIKPLQIAFQLVGNVLGWLVQQLKDFADWLGIANFALDEAAAKAVETANKQIEAAEKKYGREIKLAEEAGKAVLKLEKEKQEAIMRSANMGISALEGLRERNKKLSDDEQKQLDSLIEKRDEAAVELELIDIREGKNREERRKKALEDAKKAALEELRVAKLTVDQKIAVIQQAVIDREKVQGDADKEILEIQKAAAVEYVQVQIDALRKILSVYKLTGDEKKAIELELAELQVQLTNAMFEKQSEAKGAEVEFHKVTLDEIAQLYNTFMNNLNALFQSFTDRRIQQINLEKAALEENYTRELELAGDNEKAKSKLKNDFARRDAILDKKKLDAQRRQAVYDKAVSAVQAAIATALAVSKALPNIPLSIAVGIAGALQVAAILSKPLPKYEKGTRGKAHKGGPAIVGEKGSELTIGPDGKLGLTPDHATVVNMKAGTHVLPHDESMKALAMSGMNGYNTVSRNSNKELVAEMNRGYKSLERVIKNKKEVHINYSKRGAEAVIMQAASKVKFERDFYY